MSKSGRLLLQATLVVLAMSVLPSPSHEHLEPPPSSSPPMTKHKHNGNINFHGTFKRIYAFGGSSTDSGNARIMGNIDSRSFQKLDAGSDDPAPFWASGSNNLDRNGLCDGNLMIDFLCESLGLPKLEPFQKKGADFSNGANFAIAGASVTNKAKTMFDLWWKSVPNGIRLQLQWFKSFTRFEKKPTFDDALFWLGVLGADDYAEVDPKGSQEQKAATYRGIANLNVEFITSFISGLSSAGAKFVAVQGLPPLGCLPLSLSISAPNDRDKYGCVATVNSAVMFHNDLLRKKINEIQTSNPNITVIYADSYKAFMKVFINFKRFRFAEPIKACCGYGGGNLNFDLNHLCGSQDSTVCVDAAKHINWDGIHFTAAMYQHMSSLFLYGTCSYPSFGEVMPKVMARVAKETGEVAKKAGKVAADVAQRAGVTLGAAIVKGIKV